MNLSLGSRASYTPDTAQNCDISIQSSPQKRMQHRIPDASRCFKGPDLKLSAHGR